jgi:AraC-like DNA-binding protein
VAFRPPAATAEVVRAIDRDIATGVRPDTTEHGWERDDWPANFEQVMATDILVLCSSVWMGENRSRSIRERDRRSAILGRVVPPARHLLRAKDLADGRYFEPLTVADLARVAGLSPAHFSREFRRTFGEAPHQYLLTRRLERAAALLRNTDRSVTEICFDVGLSSLGSFTTSFQRLYGAAPLAYRTTFPPAGRHIRIPGCVAQAYGRRQNRTFREAEPSSRP